MKGHAVGGLHLSQLHNTSFSLSAGPLSSLHHSSHPSLLHSASSCCSFPPLSFSAKPGCNVSCPQFNHVKLCKCKYYVWDGISKRAQKTSNKKMNRVQRTCIFDTFVPLFPPQSHTCSRDLHIRHYVSHPFHITSFK